MQDCEVLIQLHLAKVLQQHFSTATAGLRFVGSSAMIEAPQPGDMLTLVQRSLRLDRCHA
jgi:hypothetical protein